MARIVKPPYFESVVNAGEKRLLDFLKVNLSEEYILIPNVEIASTNPRNNRTQYWEYDLIAVAPHAIYNIENKDWRGMIEGDDNYWYLNDKQKGNPLKTGRQKTAILASKLKEHLHSWGKAWVQNMVTLSYDNTVAPILWQEAKRLTFQLNEKLIEYISDPYQVGKLPNDISDIQKDITDFLIGKQSKKKAGDKKQVEGYEIVEILQQEPNYTEFVVKPKGVTSSIRKRVKEYSLQVVGLSPQQLKQREDIIKNQYNALSKIKANPFILNVEFKIDDENHLFYEISDFLDENSLRAEARSKTFTFQEKISIVKNIMAALKEAHSQNIYHRDINPDNIYLSGGFAYLGNFGKSYFTDHNEIGYTVMATINEMNATPYHPLELTVGDASRASDIYSLGVLIYWLFVGEEPFKTPYDLDRMGGSLPKNLLPSSKNAALPKWLDELCNKTILVDDLNRLDSIDDLESFINESLQEAESKPKPTPEPETEVEPEDLKEGDRIGEYTIFKTLGSGGYSKVFKVKHTLQGIEYALKLFHNSVNVSSVKDEYNALVKLDHPNIVKFVWNGTAPTGQFYTLTEYLNGENLSTYTKTDAKLPIKRVYQVAKDILSALVLMQQQEKPILHRDIKPQNIIWDNQERFVLIDFNVASFAEENQDFVGTNPYLAPDLIYGDYKVKWDKSADTFALGVTLFELVCKSYPWAPKKFPIQSITPHNPKSLNKSISKEFSEFLSKAISTNKYLRFASAKEMLEALEAIGVDNTLEEKITSATEVTNPDKLYHTEISIYQTGNYFKIYDKMHEYVDLNKSINSTLDRFKANLRKFRPSLDKSIRIQIKVESKPVINETFWNGGAKTFTEGNIERVYSALKETFKEHKDQIKEFKVDVEGLNIVEYINSLYSQSKRGNFGTRANDVLSKFDKLTYSPSKLDRKLIPDILDGRYKLLIITGNAGDGKTAFIRKIEEDNGINNLERFEHKNGARFEINGIPYESNYDGSQDQDEIANNDVLEEFFSPFENLKDYHRAEQGRLIAINEGRLVEFLNTSNKHKSLARTIEDYFYNEGHFDLPDGLMIINLNLRSIVAVDENEPSLFRKQVKALTQKNLWTKCQTCNLSKKCFIKYNVDTLNDEAAGEEVISRFEWLIRTSILKRELHVTMRDLRSLLAFIITRDVECEEIEELFNEHQSEPEKYWQYYYFNISNPVSQGSGNQDRLIRLLRETDIGEVAIPNVDRDLYFGSIDSRNYLEFEERTISLLKIFNANKATIPKYDQTGDTLLKTKEIQKSIIRHHYFEGKANLINLQNGSSDRNGDSNTSLQMPSYLLRIPYNSAFKFVHVLKGDKKDDLTKQSISRAISLNEGCDNPEIDKDYLVLSSTDVKDPYSMSFRLFPLNDFELFVNKTEHLVKYLEYEPDSLIFRHKKENHIKLTLSLDLYEMLYFIQQGFSPSLNDLRGKFVELIIFKNLLSNLSYNEVIVTNDNIDFYKISKEFNNKLSLKPLEL